MNTLTNTLVSFETAKLAKEKGFVPKSLSTDYVPMYIREGELSEQQEEDVERGDFYLAPSQSLLQKYLREEYGIHVEINLNFIPSAKEDFGFGISVMTNIKDPDELRWLGLDITGIWYKTYEEALEAGLFESLKLI